MDPRVIASGDNKSDAVSSIFYQGSSYLYVDLSRAFSNIVTRRSFVAILTGSCLPYFVNAARTFSHSRYLIHLLYMHKSIVLSCSVVQRSCLPFVSDVRHVILSFRETCHDASRTSMSDRSVVVLLGLLVASRVR